MNNYKILKIRCSKDLYDILITLIEIKNNNSFYHYDISKYIRKLILDEYCNFRSK